MKILSLVFVLERRLSVQDVFHNSLFKFMKSFLAVQFF